MATSESRARARKSFASRKKDKNAVFFSFFSFGRFSSRNQRVSVPERIDIGRPEHRVERRVITIAVATLVVAARFAHPPSSITEWRGVARKRSRRRSEIDGGEADGERRELRGTGKKERAWLCSSLTPWRTRILRSPADADARQRCGAAEMNGPRRTRCLARTRKSRLHQRYATRTAR